MDLIEKAIFEIIAYATIHDVLMFGIAVAIAIPTMHLIGAGVAAAWKFFMRRLRGGRPYLNRSK